MDAAYRADDDAGSPAIQNPNVTDTVAQTHSHQTDQSDSVVTKHVRVRHPAWRAVAHCVLPIISTFITRMLPIIGRSFPASSRGNAPELPMIGPHAQNVADDRQDGADDRPPCCTDQRSAIERFNDAHRKTGTGLFAEPIGRSRFRPGGPLAAEMFVTWTSEQGLDGEWKVADLWRLASEDFAPTCNIALPPQRVFLGALKRTPGVVCSPNRRVYNPYGDLLGKTTIYDLPELPAEGFADDAPTVKTLKGTA